MIHAMPIFLSAFAFAHVSVAAQPDQTHTMAAAGVQIIDQDTVMTLRPELIGVWLLVSAEKRPTNLRNITLKNVRIDNEGRLIRGESNAQFITIDLQ